MSQPYATLPIHGFRNGAANLFPPDSIEETRRMLSHLCHAINFARDIQDCEQVSGGNNNAILFTCLPLAPEHHNRRISCVLRTCKTTWFKSTPPIDAAMCPLVALGQKLRANLNFPIPYTLVYDCTYDNPIRSPYLIQERVLGETLEHEYFTLHRALELELELAHPRNPHMERRCSYARAVAGFVAAVDRVAMPGYGTFAAHPSMPRKGVRVRGDFGVTQDHVGGRKIPTAPNFSRWVRDVLGAQMARATDRLVSLSLEELWWVEVLCQIGQEMEERGLLTDEPAGLWHSDFWPRNIMVRSSRDHAVLTGVIDWDEAKSLPRVVTRKPPMFLWSMLANGLFPAEKLEIKNAFDREMQRLRPESSYAHDAYDMDRVLVRALCMYALFGPGFAYHDEMSFRELVDRWNARDRGC
ncbi:hypothetical protein DSL72_004355 [Monilinia vaccinii-corymbosi]|uniref:Aminoglycoside phosphotransferase domain-containing protein n=1 Tax=Monilinia vaccinii-corymbosi TaxID=61207 RepID=A0A8A3P9R6_9HELO|nr:hypothetical protein DSL72_004355 [Monilinia vaccinii-corymbosi]